MASIRGPERLVGLAALATAMLAACSTVPPPTASPSATIPSPPASPSAGPSPSAATRIPPLLLAVPAGEGGGLWRLDPNVDPASPSWRTAIGTPPGRWIPTPPAAGDLVGLTSVGETPLRVALVRMTADGLVPIWELTLPSGDLWTGAAARCVSPDGTVAVGDGGETLYTVDSHQRLTLIPGQRSNLGECTWLDSTTLLWDQEDAPLAFWRTGARTATQTDVQGRDPSAGGNRLTWFQYVDDLGGTTKVASFQSSAAGWRLGTELGHLVHDLTVSSPGNVSLSPDGGWLVGLGLVADDAMSIYAVTDAGLVEARRIPMSSIPFVPGDSVTWMPSPP